MPSSASVLFCLVCFFSFFFFFLLLCLESILGKQFHTEEEKKKKSYCETLQSKKLTGMKNCRVALARCTKGCREELMITLPFAELCVTSPKLADSDPKGTSASLRSVSEIRV